jgi:carbon-monoxide dehydrogenase large subunit
MATVLPKLVGDRIKRREDPALIQGLGRYVDDVPTVGTLHAAFFRSPYAHARIKSLDVEAAKSLPGVVTVLTGADLLGKVGTVPCGAAGPGMKVPVNHALAVGKVGFVGQPVAVVVANNPYVAEDAVNLITMDVEVLPAVVDPEQAAQPGAPRVHDEFDDNIMFRVFGPAPEPAATPIGVTDEWFRQADTVVSLKITQQRLAPMYMEPRGVLAAYDRGRGKLTVWISTQIPHLVRTLLAGALSMPENRIQVIAPDVGGGFGAKIQLYPEELVVPYLARQLGKPVKWIEKRREHFTSTIHGRGLVEYFDAAVKNDGTLLAVKCRAYCDMGAYMQLLTPAIPGLGLILMAGAYDAKAIEYEQIAVFTNKVATDAYRGAGRPEAAYAIERLMDTIARELKLDPAEVRRKNFIQDFAKPTPAGLMYDSGNYPIALDKALQMVGYQELRAEQQRLRQQGRYLGIGISSYIEISCRGHPWGYRCRELWHWHVWQPESGGRWRCPDDVGDQGQGQSEADRGAHARCAAGGCDVRQRRNLCHHGSQPQEDTRRSSLYCHGFQLDGYGRGAGQSRAWPGGNESLRARQCHLPLWHAYLCG